MSAGTWAAAMIPVTTCKDQQIAVFGLGRSGLVTCNALRAGGANVLAWDDNAAAREEAAEAGIKIVDLHGADWTSLSSLVLAPGVPLTHPKPHWTVELARSHGVEVIGDVELFCRERRALNPHAPFIAITGTNGKSTTTALVAHVLKSGGVAVQVGGNIGVAILSLAPLDGGAAYVIEMSSYQIDLTPSLDPTVGVLLNVTPDHIDRHGTFDLYAAIKERLVAEAGCPVIAVDDPTCRMIAERLEQRGVALTQVCTTHSNVHNGIVACGQKLVRMCDGESVEVLVDLEGIRSLRGTHNAQNAAAATAVAREVLGEGSGRATLQRALATFPGLAHRMEQVGRRGRVVFINDSKATNADSADKALAAFDGDIFWIAGGVAKEGGIESLRRHFPKVSRAYLIGAAAPVFAKTIGDEIPVTQAGTLADAVRLAASDAAQCDGREPVVLLSPACASFDQYRNFEVRGDAFRAHVAELPGVELFERVQP